jgi:glycosyltransferase involved in cell wall biosynthesis
LTGTILYTTTSYLPAIGGAQLHTHQIASRLAHHHDVRVVTLWDSHRTDWLWGTTLNAPTEPKSYTVDGIPVDRITLTTAERKKIKPFVWLYYAAKPLAIRQIAAAFEPKIEERASKASLIHNVRIGREPLSEASLRVARRLGIPFVLAPYHHPRWSGWFYRAYHRLYRQADALLALTDVERQTLIDLGVAPARVFVIGNGPNLADTANGPGFRQRFNIPTDAPLVLFVGQKLRYKGFEALVAAADQIWAKWPDVWFVFIGPRTTLSKRFFDQHRHRCIIELDTVDLQTKTDALDACTLLCLPSTQESFGGVFAEAWSLGKPVIGANIPAVREVIDDGVDGYLVEATAGQITDRIGYLLENPSIAVKMGQAGRQKTQEKYAWDKVVANTEAAYRAVLSG